MKKIRIAQIGTSGNSHGNEIFNTLKSLSDTFEVVGYALPEGEREKFPDKMQAFDGYREMSVDGILNDPTIDAVTVETEEIYLTKYALLAAGHKKHIHMEKPGGADLLEFEKLISTVKKNGTVFHTGYMYRYNPAVVKLMQDIKNGELGEIVSVEAQMNCRHSDAVRAWLKNLKGGIMFFLGCHLIDLILQIQGKPKNIFTFNKSTGLHGIEALDNTTVIFEYDKGISFAKTCDIEKGGFNRRQLVVTGTEKTVEIRPLELSREGYLYPKMITELNEYSSEDWNDEGIHSTSKIFDRYISMMTEFGSIINGTKENPYSYDYEYELYKTVLRCCNII